MPKINQEEYELLKGLSDRWKWIARDKSGKLHIYDKKPKKNAVQWAFGRGSYLSLGNETFQFIRWEDEEAYSIQELIEEYESEKTEVKKDVDYVRSQGYVVTKRPTIPQFIADYLPLAKEDIELEKASYYAVTYNELPKWKREYDWIRENFEAFVKAWLSYPNIEVEEEQKYNVSLKFKSSFGTVGTFLYKEGGEVLAGDNFRAYYPKKDEFRLTEQEIRGFQNGDILFEHFAVKAEGLGE